MSKTTANNQEREMKATAIVYGGKRVLFSESDLRELLTHPAIYEMADNLPKWLAVKHMTLESIPFSVAYDAALADITAAIKSTTPVTFDVRSD